MKNLTKQIGGGAMSVLFALAALPGVAHAKHGGDDGGGDGPKGGACGAYTVTGFSNGAQLGTSGLRTTAKAQIVEPTLLVTGKYTTFEIDTATLGIRNYAFTGAPNKEDLTGGKYTLVWQEKTPDLKGAVLTGDLTVQIKQEQLEVTRSGGGVTMKIQAKDCATGGIFQMEAERADSAPTRVTHVLAPGVFFYDNPNFRAREGDVVKYKKEDVTVTARVNIGTDGSARFVARDSAQVATRVNDETCPNTIINRNGQPVTVKHCGRVSKWDVSSGGRLGFVTGEDATEVAPPPTVCTHKCRGKNRVRGRAVNLGFPFPVPTAVRFTPELP
jgi:hypothetical protein